MHETFAAEVTRQVQWGNGLGLRILWYSLAGVSVLVFAAGIARPLARYRRGVAVGLPSLSELPSRMASATRALVAHSSIGRRDAYAGWAHAAIFYGWLTLFAGTVVLAIDTDLTGPIFGWHYFHGAFYLGYSAMLDVLGLVLIVGLALMMVRRALIRPGKLDYARPDRPAGDHQDRRGYRAGDWAFVILLLAIAVTGYLLEGVRIQLDHPGHDWANPLGWLCGQALDGAGRADLVATRHAIWWFHGLLAIAFVAAIPYTKATHMIQSWMSLVLRDSQAGRRLQPIPEERAAQPAGYGTLADVGITHLIQLDACTRCGKCHEACPANATGKPLSPRDVILELRDHSRSGRQDEPLIGPAAVRTETLWACMQCNACVEACPVGIEQAPIINQLRRRLVDEGELDPGLQSTLQVIHKSGNSFGENRRRRGRWTDELDFEVKDARREPVEMLWFVGDYASFDPRSQRVTRALARVLRSAGVDFGILYDGERNSGNDVRRVGEEGLFEMLAAHNVETLAGCEFERVVTSDPHSLNTLRNEYPDYGGGWEVLHHTVLLEELIASGRLQVQTSLGYRVTYHDPCYLGRMNGGYDAPRRVLKAIGCELVEMPRNRDNSFCCGAGGGRIWLPDARGEERPSHNRVREALALGELDLFVVSCPKDVTMFDDAIKSTGSDHLLELRELTELVETACLPARPINE